MREPWASTFSYKVPAVRCPFCEARELIRVRSNSHADGSIERLHVCRQCSKRFRIIVDPSMRFSPLGNVPHLMGDSK
jgi:DNA-directed RNA polymerase subunit RPC12/RpoP